jgi:hypothetical protein
MMYSVALSVLLLAGMSGGPATRPLLYEVGDNEQPPDGASAHYHARIRVPGQDGDVGQRLAKWVRHQRWRASPDSSKIYGAIVCDARYFDGDLFFDLKIAQDFGHLPPDEDSVGPFIDALNAFASQGSNTTQKQREALAHEVKATNDALAEAQQAREKLTPFDSKVYDAVRANLAVLDEAISDKQVRRDALEKVISETRAQIKSDMEADPAIIDLKKNLALAEEAVQYGHDHGEAHPTAEEEARVLSARAQLAAREAVLSKEGPGETLGKLTGERTAIAVDLRELSSKRSLVAADADQKYKDGLACSEADAKIAELADKLEAAKDRYFFASIERIVTLERFDSP